MTIGSQGLKAVAGLALAAIVFAGLASCSAAVLPDGAREVPDLMVSSPSASGWSTCGWDDVHAVGHGAERMANEPWRVPERRR